MNVKLARIKLGLTQQQFRELLKVSANRIVEIEKGNYKNLKYPLMLRIAEVLQTSPVDLFFAE